MPANSVFSVTLSDELFDRLRAEARKLHVPVKWLVASLVCDTFDSSTLQNNGTAQRLAPECPIA
jgi:hypothetical protein